MPAQARSRAVGLLANQKTNFVAESMEASHPVTPLTDSLSSSASELESLQSTKQKAEYVCRTMKRLPCASILSHSAIQCPAYRVKQSFLPGWDRAGYVTTSQRAQAPLNGVLQSSLKISKEVSEAIANDKPVVALESTIYTHGFLGKDLALEHANLVYSHGGVPAIIAIVDGVPEVGTSPDDILRMIESGSAVKVSRRDISYLVGMGLTGRRIHGGTTIAGTMLLARLAGIRVFGTGGLGGVHRGGEVSMDVSADLTELGRTRVAVVSSGSKGFLDIPRTLEYLETQGCLVSTFADGRTGRVDFPAFWARDSGSPSPSVVHDEREAAAMILTQERLGIESGMLFANPIPEEHAVPSGEMKAAIEQAVAEANEKGYSGKSNTPYILGRLRDLVGDKAVTANKALVASNIVRATKIAVELSKMLSPGWQPAPTSSTGPLSHATQSDYSPADQSCDVLVAGSLALDLSCDFIGSRAGDIAPQQHVSNPARISQSVGGVGHNVALAAHLSGSHVRTRLCSVIGNDVAGDTVVSCVQSNGLDSSMIKKLKTGPATAQYVAVNDADKNLVLAMADMDIITTDAAISHGVDMIRSSKPKLLVVDGNWGPEGIRALITAGQEQSCKVAFEPVSAAKAKGLFVSSKGMLPLKLYPSPSVDLATPNAYELAAMYSAAKENGCLDSPEWFEVIDSFGMRGGARDRFVHLTSPELTDAGVPVQTVQLLPYIPTIVTKLGSKGALLTMILRPDDPRLRDLAHDEYILVRSMNTDSPVGGVYMRLFQPAELVQDTVSVNGVGDTFMGILAAGLAQGGRIEELISVGQKGAIMTLRSRAAVHPRLGQLSLDLTKAIASS